MRELPLLVVLMALVLLPARSWALGKVTTWPAPPEEIPSPDYAVLANGQPVFCYTSWRLDNFGKQTQTIVGRPVSPVSFAYLDAEGEVEIEVRLLSGLVEAGLDTSSVVVRPLARAIRPKVEAGVVKFHISEAPCQLTLEPGGSLERPLHLFINPPEQDPPKPGDPKVIYFGPGFHEVGLVDIQDSQTVYIAGGAVVSLKPLPLEELGEPYKTLGQDVWANPGLLTSNWHKNVTIRGRGILCGRKALALHQRGHLLRVQGIEELEVEGIIIRESSVWSLNVVNSTRVHVDNVKIIGHYQNNDGICIGGASEALVEHCFSHNADDSMEVKVWMPQREVTFRDCIVYNDTGGSFGLMHECGAPIEHVRYERCTALHTTDNTSVCPVVGIKLSGPGDVRDFVFEDIVIEDVVGDGRPALKVINNWDDWHRYLPTKPDSPYELLKPPAREEPSGSITNVVFRNVQVLRAACEDVVIIAENADSPITGVVFDNVVINGKLLVPGDERLKTNAWVSGVEVR